MARAVYRDLLRALNKHVTGNGNNRQFQKFVREEFKKFKDLSDPVLIEQKLSLAKDYAMLVNSVHYHKDLLLSYNIGVDRQAEQQARLKDTAHRVGLQMPKAYEELDKRL
ncbi:hypothetical protein R1sor_020332 [Riccia sorocarpa]|uniref:Complex 1 LYR protein n=1 Tax=Riccia sorocarpa TaxID=122646 RepID=A0ABD3IIS4_9MARC